MEYFIGISLCWVAGAIGGYYGGVQGVIAVLLAELGIIIMS